MLLAEGLEDAFGEAKRLREIVRPLFRALGPTKEWAESQYYELPLAQHTRDLVAINGFWRDFAAWNWRGSISFQAHRRGNRQLHRDDVRARPPRPAVHAGESRHRARARPLYLHRWRSSDCLSSAASPFGVVAPEARFLVSEQFYRHDDRQRAEGNKTFEKYVTEEFVAGVVYGANVVVSNPTATPQNAELLLQIPRGALPVLGSKPTDIKRVRLEPYSTQRFTYAFYFPAPAAEPWPHFPAHLTQEGKVLGAAGQFSFKVVRQLSAVDTTSWRHVSQHGTEAEVLAFLEKENLHRVNLSMVAWRARESAAFFKQLIALLEQRHIYHDIIYSYAVLHNDPARLAAWLRHQDNFIAELGPWFESPLLRLDPIERHAYEHLEYSPLVNQRIHRIGGEPRIPNPVLREQYQSLLRILAHKPALNAEIR
jgi:hypothetical protein